MVLKHLENHGSITPMDALEEYRCFRLAAVIFRLRKDGHNIITVEEQGRNKFGQRVRYARYRLVKDAGPVVSEAERIKGMKLSHGAKEALSRYGVEWVARIYPNRTEQELDIILNNLQDEADSYHYEDDCHACDGYGDKYDPFDD